MNELQRKDKKVVLSAKALEAIYHMASSFSGKVDIREAVLGRLRNGTAMWKRQKQKEKNCLTNEERSYRQKDMAIPSTSGSKN